MFRAFPQCWESDSSDEDSEDDLSCPPLLPRDVGDSDSESEDEEEMPKLVAARWRGDEEEVEEESWLVDAEDEEDRGAPASSQPGDFTKSVVPTGSAVEGEGQGKGGGGAAEPTLTNEKGGGEEEVVPATSPPEVFTPSVVPIVPALMEQEEEGWMPRKDPPNKSVYKPILCPPFTSEWTLLSDIESSSPEIGFRCTDRTEKGGENPNKRPRWEVPSSPPHLLPAKDKPSVSKSSRTENSTVQKVHNNLVHTSLKSNKQSITINDGKQSEARVVDFGDGGKQILFHPNIRVEGKSVVHRLDRYRTDNLLGKPKSKKKPICSSDPKQSTKPPTPQTPTPHLEPQRWTRKIRGKKYCLFVSNYLFACRVFQTLLSRGAQKSSATYPSTLVGIKICSSTLKMLEDDQPRKKKWYWRLSVCFSVGRYVTQSVYKSMCLFVVSFVNKFVN